MKIYLYLHTHWDREWYFQQGTSRILLKKNLDFYLNNPKLKHFYLDGQVSLVEDFLDISNKMQSRKLINLINENKIITGPWFSQPDFFNSLGETTIRNIEVAKYFSKLNNFSLSKIVYSPDSFGFPINFPNVMNVLDFKQFIFWRGSDFGLKSDQFKWESFNNSSLLAYRLKYGYFFLGHFIDWNNLNPNNIDLEAEKFINNFFVSPEYDHFLEQNKMGNEILLGVGHDQAPPYEMIEEFFHLINLKLVKNIKLKNVKFEIITHDKFFNKFSNSLKVKYKKQLDYGTNSKIHRTIASSRYDLKKTFREVELFLYHKLEPLQLFFKKVNKNYDNSINFNWQKTLTKFSAHDALGGCVSDEVYLETIVKLKSILNEMQTEKDLILKIISNQFKLDNQNILIFNPLVTESNNSFVVDKITLSKAFNKYFENDLFKIQIVNPRKNPFIKNAYDHDLLLVNKKMKALEIKVQNINDMDNVEIEKIFSNLNQDYLIKVENDNGDTYDFDPDLKNQAYFLEIKKSTSKLFGEAQLNELIFADYKNKQKFYLTEWIFNGNRNIQIKTNNKYLNNRISLVFKNQKNNPDNFYYQQFLSFIKPLEDSYEKWQEKYREKPINNYRTSGIIKNGNWFLKTNGTNEFYFDTNNDLNLVLYRTVPLLGKANLKNRPGATSGLEGKNIFTPYAQYKDVELTFNFQIKLGEEINSIANNLFRQPIIFHNKSIDVQWEKLGKFLIDPNIKLNLNLPILKTTIKNFVSSSWINFNNELQITEIDFKTNKIKITKDSYEK